MRMTLAFITSSALGFALMGLVVSPMTVSSPPATLSWSPPPLRPPPLDLPSAACTQTTPTPGVPSEWSIAAAERYLADRVAGHEGVDLLHVDCNDWPCIAWLRWEDGRRRPPMTYRWWSLDDAPAAALWTAQHSFDANDATLQAVVIAPARPSQGELAALQRRVDDGRARFASAR
jgi:hypothetical protein